jgi:hypothetical protein
MSAWIAHVKEYAKNNNVNYKTALQQASATYESKSKRCETALKQCNEKNAAWSAEYGKLADKLKNIKPRSALKSKKSVRF